MQSFKEILISHFGLSEEEWNVTEEYFTPMKIKAKDFFLKQGEVSTRLARVQSGLLRSYFIDDDARDITLQFFQPDMVVISPDSFNKEIPASENIIAYEECELLVMTKEGFKELYERVPSWQNICRAVSDIKNKQLQERTLQFQTMTAAERYDQFCAQNPLIIQNVPLLHIASYLGMDIATLSRIRSKR